MQIPAFFRRLPFLLILSILSISLACRQADSNESRPNVILVITDDQGYGDLSCHENPWLRTPNLDRLHEQSVRLTDFHVSPTCAPTRAALLTGHYSNRTGVWHTIGGRSLLRESESTIAEILACNGYRTGIFGKWHLGDNYPFRPQDRGFQEVMIHRGGGVGQAPDYWDNNYFDDTYFHNGKPEKYSGYCTDIWFDEALEFIGREKGGQPFFCYLSTNAPHGPFFVEDRYSLPYRENQEIPNPYFYGMLANIDMNMGRLDKTLEQLGIKDNTILIFMTDNGSSAGVELESGDGFLTRGFNAGMRGKKGSMYEGGHRVPCFIRWPGGGLIHGEDINSLTAHVDLAPTLVDLLGLESEEQAAFDGSSLRGLLSGEKSPDGRILVTDSQRIEHPEKWRRSSVMQDKWRLINGSELYDIGSDPEQRVDLAAEFPGKVNELRAGYESWWKDISPVFDEYPAIVIGSPEETETVLSSHDLHSETMVPWNHQQVRSGMAGEGWWALRAADAGTYRISLRRWPRENGLPIRSGLDPRPALEGTSVTRSADGAALPIQSAGIRIAGIEKTREVRKDDCEIRFRAELPRGDLRLQAWFNGFGDIKLSAYYVYIEKE